MNAFEDGQEKYPEVTLSVRERPELKRGVSKNIFPSPVSDRDSTNCFRFEQYQLIVFHRNTRKCSRMFSII